MAMNWNLLDSGGNTFANLLRAGQGAMADRREMDRQAARVAAGQAYVSGDKQGAARALAGAGELTAAAGIVDDAAALTRQEQEAARLREAKAWATFAPQIKAAMRQPKGREAAPALLRVAVRQAGGTPEDEAKALADFDQIGEQYLDGLLAGAERELKVVGRSVVDMTDPENIREVYTAPTTAEDDPLLDERRRLLAAQTAAAEAQAPLRAAQAERARRPPAPRASGGGRSGGAARTYAVDEIKWE